MVAKYVDISNALPGLDVPDDEDKGGDGGSDDGGTGAADQPSSWVEREVQGSHASWTERTGIAQVRRHL